MSTKNNLTKLLFTLASAILFVVLFYEKTWGVNLFLFQLFWIGSTFYIHKNNIQKVDLVLGATALVTSFFTFYHHTYLAFFASFTSLFVFNILLVSRELKTFHIIGLALFFSFFDSIKTFFKSLSSIGQKVGVPVYTIKRGLIYTVPFGVIYIFFALYANANPTFGAMSASIFDGIENVFSFIWKHLQIPVIFYFLGGLLLSIPFFFPSVIDYFRTKEKLDTGNLERKRIKHYSFKNMGLKHETQLGVFLMVTLNIMLFLLLIFEIKDVWIGFSWNGQYLKEFVHEGMTVLSVAILISMLLAIYLFRANQNFFSKNRWLKNLTYLWIGLNIVLVVSVGIRNFWYIYYFALAYKRIALGFFLISCVIGLISIFYKIYQKKNTAFLYRVNGAAVFALFLFASWFNWNVIIAKYNFSNADRAFVHLDYLKTLNNSALPYLSPEGIDLSQIEIEQKSRISESSSSYQEKYIQPDDYKNFLEKRKSNFIKNWESLSWLEWNPSEAKAYKNLKNS